ncbi:N-6 DNA methylase [Actinopolymorpha rutila]|uniref:SAM-dependent methyltransferase/predicted DNA-binding transcriptional regulator AlpA n=1 Tax=Actinopolymorpha rutila TaxID=446787 RepID=A0A852Z5Q0_9ACTN|nr:N-6 DNA methylase [Actinopolymorpha rutila]NYH87713.1 SAM-dependent methyltransferase/predicted DNA-binding transcriptional regulator AlpA [Actinopolymorpha rutila]
MPDDVLVTAAEVARIAGVGRAAVSNWRKRHIDFPDPVEGSAANPRFVLSAVDTWLREQGKVRELSGREALWRAIDAGRDEPELLELLADVATHLADPTATVTLPAGVQDALERLADESPADIVEDLCEEVFGLQQRQHLFTPAPLTDLMARITAGASTVFDPACGPGGLLRAAAEHGATSLYGQELHPALARLAQARSSLHADSRVDAGDSLRADAFPELRADAVLCTPPFAVREWGHDELGFDPRWEYGLPPKVESELAWLQHCLAHVRPGGLVVLLLTEGVASRRSGRAIRQALLRRGVLRAMIGLPGGSLMSTGVGMHLWVLRGPDSRGAEPILLVDTSHLRPARRGQVDWESLTESVLEPWRAFTRTGEVVEIPGRQRVVEPIDLLDEDVDLTPARHLPPPEAPLDPRALEASRTEVVKLLRHLPSLLPEISSAEAAARTTTTIGDLARAGALTLQKSMGRLDADEHADGPLVLTARDIATGTPPSTRVVGEAPEGLIELRPGDLVVPTVANDGHIRPWVVTDEDLLLGPNLYLVRVDTDVLDVDFLAGQLGAESAARASSGTMSGIHRLDVRRIEIPVLDLRTQRQLGERFRLLRSFREELARARRLGCELTDQLAEGLANGTLI